MPRVSIIIPTYNSSATLRCALRSVATQTYSDFEVLVVGDGCTDDSEQIVASFRDHRVSWTNLDRNCGSQSWPNNEGLRRARGQYIAYLGHDDLWFPWHLSSLVETIERTKANFVHGVMVDVWPGGCAELFGTPYALGSYDRHFVPPSAWMHHRDIVKSVGDWPKPDRILIGVDFEFQRRAFRAGARFAPSGVLSAIKFRSIVWGRLSLHSRWPQPAYLELIEQNPELLRDWLLREVALRGPLREPPTWTASLRSVVRPVVDAIGRERWPLLPLYLWRTRRARKRARRVRGMPHVTEGQIERPSNRDADECK